MVDEDSLTRELSHLVENWSDGLKVLKIVATTHYRLMKNWKYDWDGFSYHHTIGVNPWELSKLARAGIIKCVTDGGKRNYYRVVDIDFLQEFLDNFEDNLRKKELTDDVLVPFTPPVFDNIIGYDDIKKLIRKSLEQTFPTHFTFVGVWSSAKTMFLMEIEKLPGSKLIVGSTSTKAGLIDVLMTERPSFLIIEEVDKANPKDIAVLCTLMQSGYVSVTKYKDQEKIYMDTFVFMSGNRRNRIYPELLSRSFVFEFTEYSDERFIETVVGVVTRDFNKPEYLALHIANECINTLNTKDVRQAIRISKLSDTVEQADVIISTLRKYRGNKYG